MSMNNKYEDLLYKNRQLQKQLAQANATIESLRQQNYQLKERLGRYQNQQSTVEVISQGSEDQVFTQSSNQSSQEFHNQFQHLNEQAEQIPMRNIVSVSETPHIPVLVPLSSAKTIDYTPPKVIFNYQSEGSQVPKVLTKQSKRQVQKQPRQNLQQKAKWSTINSIQYSAIKTEQPILMKNPNASSLFQRVKNSKKIYDTFFVTGFSFDLNSPIIEYCYPSQSKHFPAILSLIYTQNSLKPFQNLSPGTKSPRVANIKNGRLSIKDNFIMIICKGQNGQKQYLFACEVDDILEGPDRNLYVFNRLFCFITSCNFFSEYMKIIEQFINKINSTKFDFKIISPLLQRGTKDQLRSQLQEHLRILWQKNVEQNQFANFGLGNQINIFIDVPPASESYKNLLHYRPWGILFCPIHLSNQVQQLKQKQLFGFLLIYMLTQTKVMLYSMVKSKVSQAILHALQMIKPLQYVNPIIMGTLRDQHQQYFDAPMSVIMGLWGEQKPKRKQKIEIFMNKKPSLNCFSGLIQQNRISAVDGVIFNLDTGITFGGGLTTQKNRIAIQLNHLIQNNCKSTKQQYKLFQNLLKGKSQIENPQIRQLSQKIIRLISGTQLFSVYKDKNNNSMIIR